MNEIFVFMSFPYFENSVVYFKIKVRGDDDDVTDAVVNALSIGYPTTVYGFYNVYDFNELNNEVESEDVYLNGIGWGDFLVFDSLLLLVIPRNYSVIIQVWVAFGCIVIVQLADLCNDLIIYFTSCRNVPALPIPTIAATAYAIIVNAIIEHLNLDCNDLLK